MMEDWPPFGMRFLLTILAIGFGFSFVLVPEDFALWIMLWAGYMVAFGAVNVWQGRRALGVLAPTAAMWALGVFRPDVLGSLILAWIFLLLLAGLLIPIRAAKHGLSLFARPRKKRDELVSIAAKAHPHDTSAEEVLAHFGLEQGGEQQ